MSVSEETKPSVKRRLAAVLSADVEGFSRLCGLDEAGTLSALDRYISELIEPVVRAHEGTVTNRAGDEILAEFGSAVAAVKAAIEFQGAISSRNEHVDPSRRIRFRVGLNLGEVVVREGGIFGDGVNIAARAQGLSQPDSICATEAVVQQVRGKVGAEFHSLGRLKLKNIAEPVHLFRIQPAGTSVAGRSGAPPGDASSKPSIAVLPFLNLSGDLDQGYFSDGIAEDIITDLSRFRTVSVVARNSSFGYRGGDVDVRKVANELGVQFVVEGSVRRMGETVRITVQLVNAETRAHVWAERYDAPLADLFKTQDEIIRQIIGRIVPKIEDATLEIARRRPTEMLQAYEYYLRGKSILYGATDAEGAAEAQRCFEKAIEIDPDFAYPYAYLTRLYNNRTMYVSPGQPIEPFREEARRFAMRAVALDEADPHSHVCVAWCHLWRWEFASARQHFEVAERLNPNDADRAMDCGTGWMYLGDVERALRLMHEGIRLNPHHPVSYLADLAEAYFVAHRYQEMLEALDRVPDQSPRMPAWRAAGYAHAGEIEKAKAEASRFVSLLGPLWAGRPDAGVAGYVEWLLSFSPFARAADRDHLVQGLRLAGLEFAPPATTMA